MDLLLHLFGDLRRRERADFGRFLHRISDDERLHGSHEAGFEVGVDILVDDEALGRDAGLAIVHRAGFDGRRESDFEIRGRHDNKGVGAAEFKDGALEQPSGLGSDRASRGFGAGDRHGGDTLVGEHGLDLPGLNQQGLERASRKTRAANQSFDGDGALRNVGRVLEQSDVAGHQRRRQKTEDLPEGKVPGHDGQHNAERVPAHVAVVLLGRDRVLQ